MKSLAILIVLPLACSPCPDVITRAEWKARPPRNGSFSCLARGAVNVIIHHTHVPQVCVKTAQCKKDMLVMQKYHQEERELPDIAYNFCIGGDGNVYEGRGWGVAGYPAKGYESNSTGICFIGDYSASLPSPAMLRAATNLIECGMRKGYIAERPTVIGIGEIINTRSPGEKLQSYIRATRLGVPTALAFKTRNEIF